MTTPPALVDQRGSAFSFEALRGHPVVVTFVSARCTDACPLIDALIERAAQDAHNRKPSYRFVTVTLDPKHDTRRDMSVLGREFGADPGEWQFVTGRPAEIERVMHRFGVVTEADARGVPEAHSTFIYVLDSNGRLIRTLLPSSHLSETLEEVRTP